MPPRVTIRDVAARAGVSVGTVSHVLNDSAGVGAELRERVEAAVAELGFVPSQLGRSLRRKHSDMVGMIIPDIGNPFFPSVVRGLQDEAARAGFQVILCNSDNDPAKQADFIKAVQSYRPAGIVIIPADESDLEVPTGKDGQPAFPIVYVDRVPANFPGDCVVADNYEGGRQAAEHLLALSHRRFGLIGGPPGITTSSERMRGFTDVLAKAASPGAAWTMAEAAFDRSSGFKAAVDLLHGSMQPTAIFAANDLMAIGVLDALRVEGLNCPKDVAVVGFDDLDVATLTEPSLTTVRQPGYEMGMAAAALLRERVSQPDAVTRRLTLETHLIPRSSSAAPR